MSGLILEGKLCLNEKKKVDVNFRVISTVVMEAVAIYYLLLQTSQKGSVLPFLGSRLELLKGISEKSVENYSCEIL